MILHFWVLFSTSVLHSIFFKRYGMCVKPSTIWRGWQVLFVCVCVKTEVIWNHFFSSPKSSPETPAAPTSYTILLTRPLHPYFTRAGLGRGQGEGSTQQSSGDCSLSGFSQMRPETQVRKACPSAGHPVVIRWYCFIHWYCLPSTGARRMPRRALHPTAQMARCRAECSRCFITLAAVCLSLF